MGTTEQMKICTQCKEAKPLSKFGTRTNKGKKYPTTRCRTCKKRVEKERGWFNEDTALAAAQRRLAKRKECRLDPSQTAKFILYDSRDSDRKKSRPNDLDLAFVEEQITNPCTYCGATDIRMTLDRIDNTGGHTKDNVVPACYRCNHTRRDMPAEAWRFLCEGMRAARLAGAFGEWGSKPFSRKSNSE